MIFLFAKLISILIFGFKQQDRLKFSKLAYKVSGQIRKFAYWFGCVSVALRVGCDVTGPYYYHYYLHCILPTIFLNFGSQHHLLLNLFASALSRSHFSFNISSEKNYQNIILITVRVSPAIISHCSHLLLKM